MLKKMVALMNTIEHKKKSYFGHVMRNNKFKLLSSSSMEKSLENYVSVESGIPD